MITSSRSPISLTSCVRSSSTHGDSSALTRVHSAVAPSSISRPTRISPARAASLRSTGTASSRLPSRMSAFGRDVGGLGDHLLVGEVQEVDHPRGPERDLGRRCGRPDGQRLEEVAGVAHVRDDIDSPVNVQRWYSLRACAESCSPRSSSLSPSPAAAQAHRVRCAPPVRRPAAQVRYAVPALAHGSALTAVAARATARPDRSRSRARSGSTTSPSRCRAISRAARSWRSVAVVNRRPRGSQAPDLAPDPARRRRPSRSMRAPVVSRGAERARAALRPGRPRRAVLGRAGRRGDLRFALRGGSAPPGVRRAAATIVQALGRRVRTARSTRPSARRSRRRCSRCLRRRRSSRARRRACPVRRRVAATSCARRRRRSAPSVA